MMRDREKKFKADRLFLIFLLVLICFGLVALISASAPLGYAKYNDAYYFVKRQLLFGLLPGLAAFIILAKINYSIVERWSYVFYGFSLLLLVLIFAPGLGMVINGQRSWLHFFGYNFQPSEFVKITTIILLAHLLTYKNYDWQNWRQSLLPILAFISPTFILILLQPDIGTVSILAVIVFVMLFIGKVPAKYLAILGALAIVAFGALVYIAPYRANRLTTFLHPELDPQGQGYQINQAFLAIGSGGWLGLGLGHSRQKFQYLPEVNNDSIFAVIAEELGFVVSAALVMFVLAIGWRGFKIASACNNEFGRLAAAGIIVWFLTQSFLNIGAISGVFPLTGVPLPFVSSGGSALLIMLAAMGLVANISKSKI